MMPDPPSARCAAIVTAAGSSERMKEPGKKEYRSLSGVPVIAHAVRPFAQCGRFFLVVVTVPSGHVARAEELLRGHVPFGGVRFVEGGSTRQESVRRGLAALEAERPEVVLIHDGARPWVSRELIDRVLESAERFGACVPVVEVPEAVKQAESGFILRHFARDTIRFAQTPQGFHFDKILEAHARAEREGAHCVDDSEVYDLYVGPVACVAGDLANRKITYASDLEGE